jgi:hypothetical protein
MLETLFFRHPRSVGETYSEHFAKAVEFGAYLFAAAIACLIHALVPALFQTTASRIIANLHAGMIVNRRRQLERGFAPDYQI